MGTYLWMYARVWSSGCDSLFVYMPLCLQPYGQPGQNDIHKQPLPPLPGELCRCPSVCISLCLSLEMRRERDRLRLSSSHTFSPLSCLCWVLLSCYGWFKMPFNARGWWGNGNMFKVTDVFGFMGGFLSSWSQRWGEGTVWRPFIRQCG